MNQWKNQLALVIMLTLAGIGMVAAQDGRIPGQEATRVPLGVEARQGKLVFESKDTTFQWWFDSRIQVDGAKYFENKNEMSDGTILRRVTFAMKTILWKDWQAEIDFDISEAVLDMRDAFVMYSFPTFNLSLKAGNFKEPFGMEELNSSRLVTFMERSAVSNALALGRRVGISAQYYTDYGQATIGVFGHEAGTKIDKGTRDEGYSTNARVTFAPINRHGSNLHFGTAAAFKTPDAVPDLAANTIEIKARTETDVFDPKLLHTGDIGDVNYFNRISGELLAIQGPLYLQAEYLGTRVIRWYGKPAVRLGGAYAMLSWMVTGETRQYFVDEGEIGPIDAPIHSWGALELAARYSICDLNDQEAGIHGGKSNILMLGINYYPNPNIKLMLNYGMVNLDQYATSKGKFVGDDDHSFLQVRIQASL
ncbi:MAG: porin [Ignavibacteriales bacterium]|nr:porin [Ignavibacteriales bacterium]